VSHLTKTGTSLVIWLNIVTIVAWSVRFCAHSCAKTSMLRGGTMVIKFVRQKRLIEAPPTLRRVPTAENGHTVGADGVEAGERCLLLSRLWGLGQRRKLPSGVWGRAPATSNFCAFYMLFRAFWSIQIHVSASSTNELHTSLTLSPLTINVD